MPRFRRSRRAYGRRRRYARRSRRPSASRAVPRTTYAPRHQFLKLRQSVGLTLTGDGTTSGSFAWALNRPKESFFYGSVIVSNQAMTSPLGWDQYGNIFSKYVVHATKINLKWVYDTVGTTTHMSTRVGAVYHTTADNSQLSVGINNIGAFPLGATMILTRDKPAYFKRYMSNSKIAGRNVSMFNEFVNLWDGVFASSPSVPALLGLTCTSDPIRNTDIIRVSGSITWYVSAVAIKENITLPAAMAVNALTEPGVDIGEPDHAESLDHNTAINTGVAQHKRTLSSTGLGGVRHRD